MTISPGRKFTITKNQGGSVTETIIKDGIIEGDISLGISSSYKQLVEESGGDLMNLIAQVTNATMGGSVTTQFPEFGFQIWQKSEPLKININTTFFMDVDAYTDVVLPSTKLIKLVLPTKTDGTEENKGIGLRPPGPSVLAALKDVKLLSQFTQQGEYYNLEIGNLKLENIIITKADPTYSLDVDTYGYPIYCKMSLDIETVYIATTNMVEKLFKLPLTFV